MSGIPCCRRLRIAGRKTVCLASGVLCTSTVQTEGRPQPRADVLLIYKRSVGVGTETNYCWPVLMLA